MRQAEKEGLTVKLWKITSRWQHTNLKPLAAWQPGGSSPAAQKKNGQQQRATLGCSARTGNVENGERTGNSNKQDLIVVVVLYRSEYVWAASMLLTVPRLCFTYTAFVRHSLKGRGCLCKGCCFHRQPMQRLLQATLFCLIAKDRIFKKLSDLQAPTVKRGLDREMSGIWRTATFEIFRAYPKTIAIMCYSTFSKKRGNWNIMFFSGWLLCLSDPPFHPPTRRRLPAEAENKYLRLPISFDGLYKLDVCQSRVPIMSASASG